MSEVSPAPVRVAVIGAAFTANKGSASMLQAVIDNLPAALGPCRFEVLTTYPGADARERPSPEVGIVPYRPWELVFPLLPLALAAAVCRALHLPVRALCRVHPALRALSEADVVVDVAGISFVDGRPFPLLVYNVLMTGIPLLLGARVVKCSQAMGPFRRPLNRLGARLVLPRLAAVVARGDSTHSNLRDLGLENARRAADLAFTMAIPEAAREAAARLLEEHGVGGPFVAVVPSAVVDGYCRSRGIDYPGRLAALIEGIAETGTDVILLPHAARPGRPGSRMNDLPLVRELGARVPSERCRLIDRSLPPDVLRAVIERADQLVTSRFHAMISALSVRTPVLVVGWSHKYEEVLGDFGLAEWTLDYSALEAGGLEARFAALREASPAVRARLAERLPAVVADARGSFDAVAAAVGPAGHRRAKRGGRPEVGS